MIVPSRIFRQTPDGPFAPYPGFPAPTPGIRALDFGEGQFLDTSHTTLLPFGADGLTLGCMVSMNALPTDGNDGRQQFMAAYGDGFEFALERRSRDDVWARLGNNAAAAGDNRRWPTALVPGRPVFLAATFDGVNVRLYADGQPVGGSSYALPCVPAFCRLGWNEPGDPNGWKCFSAFVATYAMGADEIRREHRLAVREMEGE